MEMKKQIVFIHGGNAYTKYEDYIHDLQTMPIDDPLNEVVRKRWQPTLREALAETHEVYYPAMPSSKNAKYTEWKIWFERYHAFLRDGVVLIGHSLGGYFLAKYLTENTMSVRVHALYLLAAPFENDDFGGEDGGDFALDTTRLSTIAEHIPNIYIVHSRDDQIVPYTHALKYAATLPAATLISFDDKGHFIGEAFPEIIEHIQAHI